MSLCYNRNMDRKVRGGFTLIELALSLVFIGILSVTVVLLIQSVMGSYRRGQVLNHINTVGMELIDDFQSSIRNASWTPATRICELYYTQGSSNYTDCVNDNAASFVSFIKYGTAESAGTKMYNIPLYGGFCTGKYTYVWNSGYIDDIYAMSAAQVLSEPWYGSSWVRLLKVHDEDRSICAYELKKASGMGNGATNPDTKPTSYIKSATLNGKGTPENSKIVNQMYVDGNMIKDDPQGMVELLPVNKMANLSLYDLYVNTPAFNTTRSSTLYSGTFILGTLGGGINLNKVGENCKPPTDEYSNLEYCAIDNFNFAITAGGV